MKKLLVKIVMILIAISTISGFAQAQQSVSPGPSAATSNFAVSPGKSVVPTNPGFGFGIPPLSLKCLEWHCQGAECICIRFTTEK